MTTTVIGVVVGRDQMSIRIQLTEDQKLLVHADPEEWARAYRHALEKSGMIEVHGRDGRTLAINPHQILFWEEAPDEAGEDPAPTARQAQPV